MRRRTGRRTAATVGALLCTLLAASAHADAAVAPELVVCADPANLPFSNSQEDGFENRIAALLAHDLGTTVRYVWNPTWKASFLRPLRKGTCDVVMGVSAGLPGVAVTRPYYTSTYVFVSMRDRRLELGRFDDSSLDGLKIGLHAVGASGGNTPPAAALARRGLADHVVGYPMWGDGSTVNPQGAIVKAVASGEIDTAIVWGPIGGYFSGPFGDRLVLSPVAAQATGGDAPFSYAISVGVRDGNDSLQAALQAALDRHAADIRAILDTFGVPLVATPPGSYPQASGETRTN